MKPKESNVYSRQWFEFFHAGIVEARTHRELRFICANLPLPDFCKLLDLCCGMGRHARGLASQGYSVTGIDRDSNAIGKARELGAGPNYAVADIRNYQPVAETFDAVIAMGQSFGHFDAGTNRDILRRLANDVRKGGRVILDLWNPEFFLAHQGERELKTDRGTVHEHKRVEGDRLNVQLKYPNGDREQFEWQLFSPTQMEQLAKSVGLGLLVSCTNFDTASLPSPADPKSQFVLERAE